MSEERIRRGPGRPRRQTRKTENLWYRPTTRDVYAQLMVAKTMLDRVPDPHLIVVKRDMSILDEMLYQCK